MSKVIVIGGGASGMLAATIASKNNEVIILESNDKCGKKILLTGNGKCNYWNSDINIGKYYSSDNSVLNNIINSSNQEKVLSLLENIGIYPKIKNGYYYPYSGQASSIKNLLLLELEKRNVQIINNFKVDRIVKQNNIFYVYSNNEKIECDKVILATGSKACPKTGSDGSGYLLAKEFGHSINNITPALVQLIGLDNSFKDWDGVRCDSKVSLYVDGLKVCEDTGEIQLTNYGISGIVTFNISGYAAMALNNKNRVSVNINFVPWLVEDFNTWFTTRNSEISNRTIEELLESVIPYKLMHVIFKKANIDRSDKWNDLTNDKKELLSLYIEKFPLEIIGTNDYDKAQVCRGGIPLNEINPLTMESNIVSDLYLVGELLDVDGGCGGFNLAFAFISGFLAGSSINDKN